MRKLLFQIHLWIGLILFAPLVLLGLSGSALVVFEAMETSKPAHIAAHDGAAHSYDEIAAAALKDAPKGARVAAFTAPETAQDAAQVRVGKGPRGGVLVDIDPYTLQILQSDKAGGRGPIFTLAHDMHGRMLIEGPAGRQVVGWLGVAMCVLGLSGIVIWWPRKSQWGRAFTVRGGTPYRVNRDLHGATGIWILVVFVTVSFTGVLIAFPDPLTKAITTIAPGRDLRATQNAIKVEPIKGAKPIGLDDAARLARAAAPDARLISIAPAQKPDQPLRVTMAQPGYQDRTPALTVLIDPLRARVIEVRDPRTYTLGETIQAWQRALHEGSGFTIVWKILVFLSGLAPLLFSLTGIAMWLIKRKARAATFEPNVEPERETA